MKILGFAGSNSPDSINKKLVKYVVSLFNNSNNEIIDLNDFEVEIFRFDREEENGIPQKIMDLAAKISDADLIVLSLAENNASYNAGFKNIYNWISRIPNRQVFDGKSVLLMATSPGGRGGASVLQAANDRFPRDGASIIGAFSLPLFNDNFDKNKILISNSEKDTELKELISKIKNG